MDAADMVIRCERFRCTLRAAVCVERQRKAEHVGKYGMANTVMERAGVYLACRECGQGGEIRLKVEGRRLEEASHAA
jgi:hypothetical protein